MNQRTFDELSLMAKGDILFREGNYCGQRLYYGFRCVLYSFHEFFVEVFYNPESNTIERISSVHDDKILDRYIDAMLPPLNPN